MGIPFVQMVLIGLLPSFLKVGWYRLRGARIGKGVRIAPLAVLVSDDIEIGDGCRIGMVSFIRARKIRLGNRVRIGTMVAIDTGEVHIGHDSQVMEQCVVGGMLTPRSTLFIGSRVKVFPYCFLNPTEPIVIEDDVGVGGDTYLFTHGSWQSVLDGFPIGFGPITIRKGVWLPWRVFILPKVEIGEYATIGAGAVINRSVPPRALAAGTPAKVISEDGKHLRLLTEEQRWDKLVSIMSELAEFLTYLGQPANVSGSGNAYLLDAAAGNGAPPARVAIVSGDVAMPARVDVLVSLTALDTDRSAGLDALGVAWFDLASGRTSFGASPMVEHVRNYLSRYGVRFSVVTDPPFLVAQA
ncbi:acyltransferase [Ramlibacter humi]|uniref:Acyltransferase n=1 Tax=Ramlibacter humi TaxID=2530451 RepID=A0A4Z0BYS0_9BURK|nr:hypothetical protein [Ramlibacter humi]TFZ03832.1 hypothetical protein EZ216_09275 [Ramlibacter humi]